MVAAESGLLLQRIAIAYGKLQRCDRSACAVDRRVADIPTAEGQKTTSTLGTYPYYTFTKTMKV